jgi:predicted regulator of Ras-like GTPase activity (Roadblock/LC7/MglB family)
MSEADVTSGAMSRSAQLDQVLTELVGQVPEIEAAAVVSFDGLAMASALPAGMDEDRVAAMSAALLSLGERAADGLGRGELSQVYIEGENGTVFLISADDEAVLVAVAARGAKTGLMLFEVRRAAASVADALRDEVLPPYGDDEPPAYDEAPTEDEDEAPPAYDYYPSAAPKSDVPALQFVTKNGWSGQNGTAAESPSWS